MYCLSIFLLISSVLSIPLQQTSLITLRTTTPPPSGGGNVAPVQYRELILEEWSSDPVQPLQSWTLPCSLPGLSAESWTEGHLSPRYPWEDQVWLLCRNIPVNSSFSYSPAPVRYVYINEDGVMDTWAEDITFANATNTLNVIPYWDIEQSLNVFYILAGGTQANGPTSPAKPASARIRVDTGPGLPPDVQGALLSSATGITINQLRILNKTLYGVGLFAGSVGLPNPMIYQIGSEGILPTGTRNPITQIPNFPVILSVWTDPFSGIWWRTGFNRTGYVARHNNSDGSDFVYPLPPSSSAGTLGGTSWSVATARQEGTDFAVYLMNNSNIVKNTYNGLQNGLPYQPVLQAPPGWRYLSAHARNPNIPTPSATSTATATSSASASATASATSSSSASSTSSPTPTASPSTSPTSGPTSSSSPSASASSSSYPSSTPTATRNSQISSEPSPSHSPSSSPSFSNTPSTTPSNGTIPLPPDNAQTNTDELTPGEQTGIGLASVAAICVAGLLLIQFNPTLRNLWTRQFGSSSKHMKKGVSFRNPVSSSDVPITISHNPNVLVQQRLEQLKDLQKQVSLQEINQTSEKSSMDRTKKQFGPVVTGESV